MHDVDRSEGKAKCLVSLHDCSLCHERAISFFPHDRYLYTLALSGPYNGLGSSSASKQRKAGD